jgi:hypothetical protein
LFVEKIHVIREIRGKISHLSTPKKSNEIFTRSNLFSASENPCNNKNIIGVKITDSFYIFQSISILFSKRGGEEGIAGCG